MTIIQKMNYAFLRLIRFSSNAMLKKIVTMTIYTLFLYFDVVKKITINISQD